KGVKGLTVPLCPTHTDDWTVVKHRSRVASFVILAGMVVTAAVVWFVQPLVVGPQNQNANSRFMATLMLGLVSAFPFGMWGLWWAKTPIRVLQVQGRMVTLAGASARFARAVKAADLPEPLPAVPDAMRFDVSWYRPTGSTPVGVIARYVTVTVAAAAFLGAV